MSVEVRDLLAEDEARWRELWAGFLEFYEHPLTEDVTATTFQRLVEQTHGMSAQVAVDGDGHLVGFVHQVFHAGTWSAAPRCYLEDLFVDPAARGTGAGRALIEATRARATEQGCNELYWITEVGNETARRLYDRVAKLGEYVRYEIDLTA